MHFGLIKDSYKVYTKKIKSVNYSLLIKMTEIYKLVHPVKYFNDYISTNVRTDKRKLDELRSMKINVNPINTAEASAIVKCGNTSVVCGIKLELAPPKAEEPDVGYLVTNLELPALCSSKYRPGPPSDNAQVINNLVSEIIVNSKCIDLKHLCIISDKLAWVIYCDMICLDNDGSVVDACIISLITCLKTLNLPSVEYDVETEEIKVDQNKRTPIKVHGLPVSSSFSIYNFNGRNILLNEPSAYEEDLCGGFGANLIISYNNGLLCGTHKFGGSSLTSDIQNEALNLAKKKSEIVKQLVDTCIKNCTIDD